MSFEIVGEKIENKSVPARDITYINIPHKNNLPQEYLKEGPCAYSNGAEKCIVYKDENNIKRFKFFNRLTPEVEYKNWNKFLEKCEIRLNLKREIKFSYILKESIRLFNSNRYV